MYKCSTSAVLGFVLIGLAPGFGASAQDNGALDALRTDPFAILPWDQTRLIDGPEDHVHGLASLVDCNFTYAGFPRVADLKACEKLGLKAIVFPDAALGLTKRHHHLSDEQIENAIRTLAEETKGSPACVGYFILDEPGASEFADLGKIVAAIRRHAPGKLAYINLLPSYATAGAPGKSQLEAKSFTEYLERYVAEVKPDFLSYDNYMVEFSKDLRDRAEGGGLFSRSRRGSPRCAGARSAVLEHRRRANQIRPNATPPSPANLLLQGWTTLAAGGRGVSWYKYKQKEYLYCPIDMEHGQTATWTYLQMVNRQLKVIGPIVSRLRSVGVYFTRRAAG